MLVTAQMTPVLWLDSFLGAVKGVCADSWTERLSESREEARGELSEPYEAIEEAIETGPCDTPRLKREILAHRQLRWPVSRRSSAGAQIRDGLRLHLPRAATGALRAAVGAAVPVPPQPTHPRQPTHPNRRPRGEKGWTCHSGYACAARSAQHSARR